MGPALSELGVGRRTGWGETAENVKVQGPTLSHTSLQGTDKMMWAGGLPEDILATLRLGTVGKITWIGSINKGLCFQMTKRIFFQ